MRCALPSDGPISLIGPWSCNANLRSVPWPIAPQDSSMVALAEERHYECRSVLEFLGIRFDLLSQECSPLKLTESRQPTVEA